MGPPSDPPNWFHSVGGMNLSVGAGDGLRLREGIARRAVLVAAVFEGAAVKRVGAGLGVRRDDRLAGLPEFGVIGRGGDLQLGDRIQVGRDHRLAEHGIAIVGAVQLEGDAAPILAADRGTEDVVRLLAGALVPVACTPGTRK